MIYNLENISTDPYDLFHREYFNIKKEKVRNIFR